MKKDIESILIANRYLTLCKCQSNTDRYHKVRNYLNHKIEKALNRKKSNSMPFSFFKSIFAGL